jgi:hypothetical protein
MFGGGDPPIPPAQGAVTETIAQTAGGSSCSAVSLPFAAPPNADPVTGTIQTLNCDLTASECRPTANVVVDGDNATVKCTISGNPDSFDVNATLKQGELLFDIRGTLSAIGGNAFVASSHDGHNLQDASCDVIIEPNKGEIKAGAIWAAFNCVAFGDPSTVEGPGCTATGKFLFENCEK